MKNFDMIFVFKDYKRKIVSVTAIPMMQLDSIKDWLKYVCVCVCWASEVRLTLMSLN